MSTVRIDIPSQPDPTRQAAKIVIERFRANGIHPGKAVANKFLLMASHMWTRGQLDDTAFDKVCRNMLIMNPSLATE